MSVSSDKVTVYQSGPRTGLNPLVWIEITARLLKHRELIWRLFVRNFSSRYRQTALGMLWTVITPVIAVGTFIFLDRSGVVNLGPVDIPYPAYAILGLTIWQLFAGGISACSNSITAGGSMVIKIKFPLESLVISSLGLTLVDTLVRLVLVALVFAYYRVVPNWTAILFPFSLIPIFLMTLGLGFILSLLNGFMRDIRNVVTFATTFLLFLTPVLYSAPESGIFQVLNKYNPLAPLVGGPRDLLIKGHLSDPSGFIWASVLSMVLFLLFWRLFYLAESRVAERMGAR